MNNNQRLNDLIRLAQGETVKRSVLTAPPPLGGGSSGGVVVIDDASAPVWQETVAGQDATKRMEKVELPEGSDGLMTSSIELEHRIIDEDERIIEARIKTNSLDGHGTLIPPANADLKNYQKNPVVLFNHNPDIVIGRTLRLSRTELAIDAQWQFARVENPSSEIGRMLEDLWVLVRDGFIRGYSVGFPFMTAEIDYPREDEQIDPAHWATFVYWDLREFSLTPIPSDPDALGRTPDLLKRWFGLYQRGLSTSLATLSPKQIVVPELIATRSGKRNVRVGRGLRRVESEKETRMGKTEDLEIRVELNEESVKRFEAAATRIADAADKISEATQTEVKDAEADVKTRLGKLEERLGVVETQTEGVAELGDSVRALNVIVNDLITAVTPPKEESNE